MSGRRFDNKKCMVLRHRGFIVYHNSICSVFLTTDQCPMINLRTKFSPLPALIRRTVWAQKTGEVALRHSSRSESDVTIKIGYTKWKIQSSSLGEVLHNLGS